MRRYYIMHICRNLIFMTIAAGLALAASSCIYEYDKCPPALTLKIENDWQAAPEADPEGLAYMFFSDLGGEPWRFDFAGREGGEVSLIPGDYSFVSFNDDTYNVRFREDGGYEGYEAYTVRADDSYLPAAVRELDEKLHVCPDMMWGCSYDYVGLKYSGLEYGEPAVRSESYILRCPQRHLTARYSFLIENVTNLDGVVSLSAVFTGLACSLNLADGAKGDYPCMLPSAAKKGGETSIEGEFLTFGIPAEPTADNYLLLFVVLSDGRKFTYHFDVTPQVRNAPDPLDVKVIIRGLELEESEGGSKPGGGFDVSVDGWISITINIQG